MKDEDESSTVVTSLRLFALEGWATIPLLCNTAGNIPCLLLSFLAERFESESGFESI